MANSRRFGISGSTLKIIAIVTMLIDHTAATFVSALTRQPYIVSSPETLSFLRQLYSLMRDIGRIAFLFSVSFL